MLKLCRRFLAGITAASMALSMTAFPAFASAAGATIVIDQITVTVDENGTVLSAVNDVDGTDVTSYVKFDGSNYQVPVYVALTEDAGLNAIEFGIDVDSNVSYEAVNRSVLAKENGGEKLALNMNAATGSITWATWAYEGSYVFDYSDPVNLLQIYVDVPVAKATNGAKYDVTYEKSGTTADGKVNTHIWADKHDSNNVKDYVSAGTVDWTNGYVRFVVEETLEEPTTEPATELQYLSGMCGDHLMWLYINHTLIINGTGDMEYSYPAPWDSVRSEIEQVIIEDGVTSIATSAFSDCTSLTSVTISDSVSYIGGDSFENTPWLNGQRLKNPLVAVNGILIDGKTCEGDVTIPDGVTSIGEYAFGGCAELRAITIPNSVTSIGHEAFSGCASLRTVMIPEGATSIGYAAFAGCSSLTSVTIAEGVTEVGAYAFANTALISVTIPDSVTSIGTYAFVDCENLISVVIKNPDCGFDDFSYKGLPGCTISNGYNEETDSFYYYGIICSYDGSTAQTYAETNGYTFASLGATPSVPLPGDVNEDGKLNIMDVITLNKNILGGCTLSDAAKANADVDGNGKPEAADSLLIMKFIVGLIDTFPYSA